MIIGPGRTPWISIAAISTAAGAEPGMPSVSTGMIAPGTQALSPVSAAIRPSIEPLPNFSGSLLARLAAAYEDQAATSSPTPGRMPMNVPMKPERRIVRQYRATSTSFGMTESNGLILTGSCLLAHRHQELGEAERADERRHEAEAAREIAVAEGEAIVGVDRLLAERGDEQMPRKPAIQPLSGSPPVSVPEMITPNTASQKNS